MSITTDIRFWDQSAKSYSQSKISDQTAYQRTLDRTSSFLEATHRVLELGCGTGSTALLLAAAVRSYLATDVSPAMIRIANEKIVDAKEEAPSNLSFLAVAAEDVPAQPLKFHAVLGFNYLHLVRDFPGTLQTIHSLLQDGGLLITKTPCVGDMNPLIRMVAIPVMQFLGKAPYAASIRASELAEHISKAGFNIIVNELHSKGGNDNRPFIVARKM